MKSAYSFLCGLCVLCGCSIRLAGLKTVFAALALVLTARAADDGAYFTVAYPPSTNTGALQIGVTHTVWIPPGVKTLRGVIVHQHGCGEGACKGGATAAYDLHWQALAKKWDCALLGPSYQQAEGQECQLWCDPRNGSGDVFLRALADLGAKSNHPELDSVPWCLWGHSGGGTWAGTMLLLHPERCAAVWLRSGTPRMLLAEVPTGNVAAAYAVPLMANPGVMEKDHARFGRAWTGTLGLVRSARLQNAPYGFAPDPRTGHECGDSRYLAIPFFDACLAARLPDAVGDARLKPMPREGAWLAPILGDVAVPAEQYTNEPSGAVWLPNEAVAKAWMAYVKTGTADDTKPPPAPTDVRISDGALTWRCEADFESGLAQFLIERDGQEVGRVPEKPAGPFGRPLFQKMSYHDTPEAPLPAMRYALPSTTVGVYRVVAVNSAGLRSPPSAEASP